VEQNRKNTEQLTESLASTAIQLNSINTIRAEVEQNRIDTKQQAESLASEKSTSA
jgi:hypothetical protein